MNAMIRKVSGTYSVVQFVADDKLDQLATLLGLDDAAKAKLKSSGPVDRGAGRRRQVRQLKPRPGGHADAPGAGGLRVAR